MDPGATVAGGDECQTIVDRIAQLHRIDLGIGTDAQQTSVEPMISEEGTHLALDESGLELDGIGHGHEAVSNPSLAAMAVAVTASPSRVAQCSGLFMRPDLEVFL